MRLYDIVLAELKKNKAIREKGEYVGVPNPFPRISEYWPAYERGHSIGLLGPTGSGKSRLARFMSIYTVYKLYKETGYKCKIFYFPLEDSPKKVYKNMICHYLKEIYGITISLQELNSVGSRFLPDFVEKAIEEAEGFFDEFEKVVAVISDCDTPSEMFSVIEKFLLKTGTKSQYEVVIEDEVKVQDKYESDIHTFVLIDNYSNISLDEDKHDTERAAVLDLAKNYVREKLCNIYQCTAFQVLQTDFQTERQQYGSDGKAIMSKVEPNLASIGDVKTIARSMHVVIGMFDPVKHEFMLYPQVPAKALEKDPNAKLKAYDLDILGNRFRALRILKNNDGDSGMKFGMLFDALGENFEELPVPESQEMQGIYEKFKKESPFVKVKTMIDAPQQMWETQPGEELPF